MVVVIVVGIAVVVAPGSPALPRAAHQAPLRRAPPPRSGTAAISWRELVELKEELIAQMGEAEAMEATCMYIYTRVCVERERERERGARN